MRRRGGSLKRNMGRGRSNGTFDRQCSQFGGIKGLVAINFFGVWYPNFVDLNIYDSLQFLFCELLPSFIVGRKNKMWDSFKIEDLNNQQFMILEFEQRPLLNREESGNNLENGKTIEDKLDEILDKFDGKQTK